jgi:hypothetical protein
MKMKTINNLWLVLLITLICLPVYTSAQEKTKEDLEKAIQNPIANIVSLPFQNNTDFGIGEYDRTKNTLNIQPVLPFSLGESVNLIVRTIIPIISQPIGESETTTGLGDISLSTFFTPAKPGKLIWGIGPVFGFPSATDNVLGSGKWSMGPSILLITQPEGWSIGTLVQNTWSYAGDENRSDVSFFYSQIFIVKNLPDGWYLNTAPIITANWKASSGNQWTVPIGIGGGKLIRAGKLPINIQVGYYNYVVKPDGGPKWQLRAQVVFILPKFY